LWRVDRRCNGLDEKDEPRSAERASSHTERALASQQSIVDFILEQAAGAGLLRARKMFGEYAIYRSDQMIALVCENRLYLKRTDAVRQWLTAPVEGAPYPKARPHLLIGEEFWEDREYMARLFVLTDQNLPPPAPKKPRPSARVKKSA
jgi:TfoX/Sxy family transcriptional regulator of competence genes